MEFPIKTKFYSVNQFDRILQEIRRTVVTWIQAVQIKSFKVGRIYRIPIDFMEGIEYLERSGRTRYSCRCQFKRVLLNG